MGTKTTTRFLLFSVMLTVFLNGFCHQPAALFLIRPSLIENSLSPLNDLRDRLFIERASRMASQDSLTHILPAERPESIFFTGLACSYSQRQRYYAMIAANPGRDIFLSYKKIEVSPSGNLDYKKFAEQLPKKYDASGLGYLLYGIFNKGYLNAPPNPNPAGR